MLLVSLNTLDTLDTLNTVSILDPPAKGWSRIAYAPILHCPCVEQRRLFPAACFDQV